MGRPRQPQGRLGGHAARLLVHGAAHGAARTTCGPSSSSSWWRRSGSARRDTVHNAYLSDAYPDDGPGAGLLVAQPVDPLSQTVGHPRHGLHRRGHPQLALGAAGGPRRRAHRPAHLHPPRAARRGPTSRAPSCGRGHGHRQPAAGHAPKVLLGPAVTRLLAHPVALLRAGGRGHPGLRRHRHPAVRLALLRPGLAPRATRTRAEVYSIIGLSAFLGLPDGLPRRRPAVPPRPADAARAGRRLASPSTAACSRCRCTCRSCGWSSLLQFLAQAASAPLSISIFQTLAATAPPEMRAICFGMFGVYALVFGGFAGARAARRHQRRARVSTFALTLIGPVCAVGRRAARRRFALRAPRHHARHRGRARALRRGQATRVGRRPSPRCRSTTSTSSTAPSRCSSTSNLEVAEGEIVALLGTNGAGQVHVAARRRRPRPPPPGRDPALRRQLHLPRARADRRPGRGPAGGREDDVPGPDACATTCAIGEHSFRRDGPGPRAALDEAIGLFPELGRRLDQPAGTLSGGEQQMLALARVMMTTPRLLMIDELSLGLAPMTVERLMDIVRRVNADGHHGRPGRAEREPGHDAWPSTPFFLERGEIRFDGPTTELLGARRPAPAGVPRRHRPDRLRSPCRSRLRRPRRAPSSASTTGCWPSASCSSTAPTGSSTSPRASSAWSRPCSW